MIDNIMKTKKQIQVIEYSIVFNKLFKKILKGNDTWSKNTDLYLFLLRKIEELGNKKIINRIQKSRMCKSLELVYIFYFWKSNPNVNLSASIKEVSNYFANKSFYDELNKLGFVLNNER